MTQITALLELRSKIKDKKPEFIRQDNPKRMKLNYKWRKPKGIHSKIRHKFKGRRKMPSPGYKSPRKVKNLHSSGLKMINVESVDDIKKIKKQSEGVIIAKSVGMKKRFEILKIAKDMQVSVLNLNVDEQIKKIQNFVDSKKKTVAKETRKEEVKKEELKEKETVKEQKDTGLSEKEKKEVDKKEKDKVLTKRK